MKVLKQWSFGVLFLLSFSKLQAQYREVGLVTSASMGIMYGPVLDARPVYKWGKSISRVSTIRAERTYMNYAQYQDNNYFSLSTGFFTGQEWRKPMADRLYYISPIFSTSADTLKKFLNLLIADSLISCFAILDKK